jgi:signal transduction histidine kinase
VSLGLLGVVSTLLIGAVFAGDVLTPQELVFAILYNVPIALTGLAFSRPLTLGLTLLALLANAGAGFLNAQQVGSLNTTAILNRLLAALSFFLVAFLSLQAAQSSMRLAEVRAEERRTRRERQLRQLVEDLSGPLTPPELLERAARVLKNFFEADAAAVLTLRGGRWGERLYVTPKGWQTPSDAPTASQKPVRHLILSGRSFLCAQLGPDMLLLFENARLEGASVLLADLVPPLEALLGKADLFANLQQQQGELSRRNIVIRDLIYAFSHDLRTPLMANAMNMRLALEGAYGELPEELRKNLRNGLEANQDLLELADQLLLVARLESGEAQPPRVPLDFSRLVREGVERLEGLWKERDLKVAVHAPEHLELSGREVELRRLLQNLLDNAARFAPPGSEVEVRLERIRELAVLEVADRGPGIPPEARERLFTRFSSNRAGGGKGLGLYLARQIAESHGGSIRYLERSGGGSLFRVELPISAPVPGSAGLEEAVQTGGS